VNNTAIRAENLSKQYDIAKARCRYDTLREQITEGVKSVFRRGANHAGDVKFWALRDVSFEIKEGETVGIIGHNGAGKSTLLKILSRITVPTCGQIEVFGQMGSLLEVGTGFHPELTGRENIYLNGAIIGMKREEIRRHFDAIVDFAEIGQFLDVPVKRYSSGMYVRLAFAVAAHLNHEILLIDEVLAVGDVSFQKKCLGKMGEVAKAGRTVVFVSHSMTAISSLCERVLWLNGGHIVEDGPSAGVVMRYLFNSLKGEDLNEEVWDDPSDAPGNHQVRLHRIRVCPEAGCLAEPLTMQTPFRVEVEFWNLVEDAQLHITLHLYTADGIIALTTGGTNHPMSAGLYRSVCYFPENLLNSGLHRFVVLVVKDKSSVIFSHESSISCNILDVREREGAWFGKEPGVVQPLLKWTTEMIEAGPEI
jgi:lipopolysaccharide transport system ATP-binding protein